MIQWTQAEQRAVAKVVISRWPGGIRNQGWDLDKHADVLEAFLSELQRDGLTAHWAIVGLQACDSDFVPSVGGVTRRAREAKGPASVEDIQAATERVRLREVGGNRELPA